MAIEWTQLSAHFPIEDVEFKPQTMSKDGTKALAIAYVDPRAYQRRLDDVVGVANWWVEYRSLGERAIIARITITDPETGLKVIREEVGEFDDKGLAQWPTASAQAFKRACVTLGLGRYLYDLPQTWVSVENRRITDGELNRLRAQLAKAQGRNTTQAPSDAPRQAQGLQRGVSAKPIPNGQQGVQTAKAVARISELLGQAKDADIEITMPANWPSLEYNRLIDLGKSIAKVLEESRTEADAQS